MVQGALGAAGVRRVWAGAGLQRAVYRGGAYCVASAQLVISFWQLYLSRHLMQSLEICHDNALCEEDNI